MLVLTFIRANWRWLAAVLAVIFGVLVVTQGVSYLSTYLHRRRLGREQDEASAAHTQQQAVTTARYTDYRLDSVRAATERQEMLHQALKLKKRDDSLTRQRPARVPLPAYQSLPRE